MLQTRPKTSPLLGLIAFCAAGCNLVPQQGQFFCEDERDCPPKWVCYDGACYAADYVPTDDSNTSWDTETDTTSDVETDTGIQTDSETEVDTGNPTDTGGQTDSETELETDTETVTDIPTDTTEPCLDKCLPMGACQQMGGIIASELCAVGECCAIDTNHFDGFFQDSNPHSESCESSGCSFYCETSEQCFYSCDSGSCEIFCGGEGECTHTCDSGSCTGASFGGGYYELKCQGGGCTISCPGGNCILDCAPKKTCSMTDCPMQVLSCNNDKALSCGRPCP